MGNRLRFSNATYRFPSFVFAFLAEPIEIRKFNQIARAIRQKSIFLIRHHVALRRSTDFSVLFSQDFSRERCF